MQGEGADIDETVPAGTALAGGVGPAGAALAGVEPVGAAPDRAAADRAAPQGLASEGPLFEGPVFDRTALEGAAFGDITLDDAALDEALLAEMGSDLRGVFITFEGLDGCGKSTQMELLAEGLRERGYVVLLTREPGGTQLGEAVRDLLLDRKHHGMSARAEALLYAAARAQLVEQVIRPALKDGQVVLCDRYIDSSLAYQGCGRGLGTDDIVTLNVWATECLFPDLTILLDLDDYLRSTRLAAVPDRLEAEDEEFHRRVGDGYRMLPQLHPHRIRKVDATGGEADVQGRVRAVIEEELELFSH